MFGTLLRNFTLRDSKVFLRFFGADTWSGKPVTPATAMQVSAFWACVRLVAETIATLPVGVYRRRADGGRDTATDHPLYVLLHDQPNADQTACEFWEGVTVCLCIWGNAYGEKVIEGGRLIAINLLRPDLMAVDRDRNGALRYVYSDPREASRRREFGEDEVFHVRGFGIGGDVGLSVLQHARQTLGAAIATDEASARMFANGMRPSGFFTYQGKSLLSPEQREQARKVLVEPYQGSDNAGKVGILEAASGFTWQEVSMPAKDAEMLASRHFNVEEIARWVRVPPILIGHSSPGQTMFGAGVEQVILGWLTLGLRPYLTRVEQAIKKSLIAPGERSAVYAEFAIEGLLRADSAGRAAFYSTMAQNGFITRNEGRARENLSPKPGGDVLTVQSNLLPIERLGAAGPDEAAKSALRSWLGLDTKESPDA